jgi:hypothetical protein
MFVVDDENARWSGHGQGLLAAILKQLSVSLL